LTHALKPSAAAGRVPLPDKSEEQSSDTSVPVIVIPPVVQDQLACEYKSPVHFRVHV